MEHFEVIVLGVGGVGSAALHHLAARGLRVLGIDRFRPPHDRGSTHGQTRVIRQAYFEHSNYVPLLMESYRLWHELEALSHRRLLHQIGLIEVGPVDGIVVPGVLQAAVEHGLAVESLTASEVEARWSGLQFDRGMVGVFEPAAGYLLVEDCVQAQLDAATAAGAELLVDTEVTGWTANDTEVRVRTANGDEFAAARLIVAAGAWSAALMQDLHLSLTVLRKSLFWYAANDRRYDVGSNMPVFLYEMPEGVFYGFPSIDVRSKVCRAYRWPCSKESAGR